VLQKSVTNTPISERRAVSFSNRGFVRDLVLTLLASVFTGVSGAVLLILLVFGWNSAQADSLPQALAAQQPRSLDGQSPQQAPMLKSDVQMGIEH
jgi:hypothetical protein